MREEETSLCGVRISLPAVGKLSISCQKVLPAQISYWSSRNFNSYNISGVFQSDVFCSKRLDNWRSNPKSAIYNCSLRYFEDS